MSTGTVGGEERERERLTDTLGWVFVAILARVAILLQPSLSYGLTSSGTSRQPGTCASDFPASLLTGLACKAVIAFVKPPAVSHAAQDPERVLFFFFFFQFFQDFLFIFSFF